ncbi:MAG: type III secretion system chaperone [Polaromonas sp.]|nr:type III secretion system chaperone [Polaromonas sp.]
MNMDPQLVELVRELGHVMAFDDLALDRDGACAVRFDGRTVVNLQGREDSDSLWLFADLGPVSGGVELYADLLRGNLFWRATLGATISLSGDEPAHVIMTLPVAWRGLRGEQLALKLETFVNTLEDWAGLLEEGRGADLPQQSFAMSMEMLLSSRA